ncbi:AAA family ATPase [Candidatus Dependentiae bacterium]|nr:AAA family ATPase [Candidatus Dependentiae bacterium]
MTKFNQFLKKELNKPQLQAVINKKGPLIVIAGAGSGKTRVITARMANLIINENVNPSSIVALTFTNKAANEMKERLNNFLDNKTNLPFVGTFHSYCLLLLRSNPTLLEHPKFTILDGEDQKSLIKKIIKRFGLEKQFSVNELVYQISNLKNKLTLDFENFSTPIIKEIYLEYESEKAKSHSFDFDDLLLKVLNIFKTKKEFRIKFQEKIKHVLVDEYQDTNMVQHELLRYISLNEKQKFCLDSLCAVGDEDQSIYSWRGAIATNMQKFQKDFKPVTLVKIEQNYRSVQPILKAANNVIENNKKRTHKELWSDKKAKNRILSVCCRSGKQEANTVATFIENLPKDKPLNQTAILYRTHYQSRNIEEALLSNSIPYKIIGGIRFYERKEIKDLLAYLRLIVNPYDRVSLLRVINCPTRGLGAKFEVLLHNEWNKNPLLNFKQLLNYLLKSTEHKLTTTKKTAVLDFLKLYEKIENLEKASDQIEEIIENIRYFSYLQKHYDIRESEIKTENVKEFIQSIYNFEKENEKNDLEEFLHQITLMQEKTEDKGNNDQIQCMTLHAVKGLEFDNVIIIGLEEGLLPSSRSLNTNKELEEERRLFYVGMTRARERLILMHAYYRNSYGQISDQVISRFLTEIPDNLIKNIDISEKSIARTTIELKNWLGIKSKSVLTFHDFANDLAKNMEFKTNTNNKKLKTKPKTNKTKYKLAKRLNSKKIFGDLTWKKNQSVNHPKFGIGLIKKVEKKDGNTYYLTINFKSGEKKILSSFVAKI